MSMAGSGSTRADAPATKRRQGGRKTHTWILILPRTQVIQRLIDLPTGEPREIEQLLTYRIPVETPFLPEQVTWSWSIAGRRADGSVVVRATLVENQRLQQFLDDCGIDPAVGRVLVEDDLLAIWHAHGSPPVEDDVCVFEHQDRLLAVQVRGAGCVRSSAITKRRSEATEQEIALLLRGLAAFPALEAPADPRQPLASILPGKLHCQAGLAGLVGRVVSSPSAEFLNPLAPEQAPPVPGGKPGIRPNGVRALPRGGWLLDPRAIGDRRLATSIRDRADNQLLPARWKAWALGRRDLRVFLVLTAAAVTGVFLATFGAQVVEGRWRDSREATDSARLELKQNLEEVQAAQMLIEQVESWSGRGKNILSAWDRIAACAPSELSLTGALFRESGEISIQGISSNRTAIVTLMEALRSDPAGLFRDVRLGGFEEREGQQAFQIFLLTNDGTAQASP